MDVSVVVPVLDEADSLPNLLNDLREQSVKPVDILIVDGGSSDGTQSLVRSRPEAKLVSAPGTSMGEAFEIGALEACTSVVAKTDGDALVPPDWVERIKKDFEQNPGIYLLGGVMETYREEKKWFNPVFKTINEVAGTYGHMPGANLAVRREAVEELGWPDRNVGEDLFGSHRVAERYPSMFDPDLVVYNDFDPTFVEWYLQARENDELVDWVAEMAAWGIKNPLPITKD